MSKFSICFVNKIYPIGGSGTFLKNFIKYLTNKKYLITKLGNKKKIDYIFITGSNLRNIIPILYYKYLGSKIINRVDGKIGLTNMRLCIKLIIFILFYKI